jgi:hypothetical protein
MHQQWLAAKYRQAARIRIHLVNKGTCLFLRYYEQTVTLTKRGANELVLYVSATSMTHISKGCNATSTSTSKDVNTLHLFVSQLQILLAKLTTYRTIWNIKYIIFPARFQSWIQQLAKPWTGPRTVWFSLVTDLAHASNLSHLALQQDILSSALFTQFLLYNKLFYSF